MPAELRIPLLQFLRTVSVPVVAKSASDAELLGRFVSEGNEEAFTALVKRYGPLVLGVCRRVLHRAEDVEDAFQATFIVLVRKAGVIGRDRPLGSWLYGVARRVARKAGSEAAKRRAREGKASRLSRAKGIPEMNGSDLHAALEEEVGRLPEKYRAPILLCYFEGKTKEEAGLALGWPGGTVSTRLARGRQRLREALRRRGVVLSGAALFAILTGEKLKAAVPTAMLNATVQAGLLVRDGGGVLPTLLPRTVVDLVNDALRTGKLGMQLTCFAILSACLSLGVSAAAGVVLPQDASETPGGGGEGAGLKSGVSSPLVEPVTGSGASAKLTENAPILREFSISYGSGEQVTLSGLVQGGSPGGHTVTFIGATAGSAHTWSDGHFRVVTTASSLGVVTATAEDRLGRKSNSLQVMRTRPVNYVADCPSAPSLHPGDRALLPLVRRLRRRSRQPHPNSGRLSPASESSPSRVRLRSPSDDSRR